jgi:hypothetical protein
MNTNGLNENFNYPTLTTTDSLGHMIKQRLYDQNIQNTENKIKNSTRFNILYKLKKDFQMSNYLNIIKNPKIRNIFTRLRTDLNILNTCKTQTKKDNNTGTNVNCPHCPGVDETVPHFLLYCHKFHNYRVKYFKGISDNVSSFPRLNDDEKLNVLLNLDLSRCSGNALELVSNTCNFVFKVYKERLNV